MKHPIKKLFAVAVMVGTTVGAASADAPRALVNGRPACGNTMGKGRPRSACEWERLIDEARNHLAAGEQRLSRVVSVLEREVARVAVNGQRATLAQLTAEYAHWKATQNPIASR